MPAAAPTADPRNPAAPVRPLPGEPFFRVEEPADAAPIVRVPLDRLEEVRGTLLAAGFEHYVRDSWASRSLPAVPFDTLVLRYEADAAAAQRVLDRAARDAR